VLGFGCVLHCSCMEHTAAVTTWQGLPPQGQPGPVPAWCKQYKHMATVQHRHTGFQLQLRVQ
jgi:hypothetical protein